ncbi:MAG TPA: phosphoribosyltransferase family protein [Gemmatimonadaceae bacterium]|nr:phosphoribosyltransferase family protein [Gemmatimonadaceae bacterium]
MSPSRTASGDTRGVLDVDWPLFGELSRALALKVARAYDPEVVIGIATAGVVPGAVVAAILQQEFHSILVTRRQPGSAGSRQTPAVLGAVPAAVRDRRVLVVDETCDSGETMRLALAAVVNGGAADARTAVGFRTGSYEPDFSALDTDSTIILPWDREVLVDGALVLKPEYALALERSGGG